MAQETTQWGTQDVVRTENNGDRSPKSGRKRSTGKILAVAAICAAVAAGGIGVATAPQWAHAGMPSEASSPMRNVPGLAAPVVKPVELGVTPTDEAKGVNPAAFCPSRPSTVS